MRHQEIYDEWKTTIHSDAHTDPYYQVDFVFDGSQQICLNCHTPLVNQQENLVLGFNDQEKLDPILAPNPDFDSDLQKEGVTCVVCHVKDGVIVGPYGSKNDAHPSRKGNDFTNGASVCRRCHMVSGHNRWDVFMKLPPCGNFAVIEESGKKIDCVKCHMPSISRPLADGGKIRSGGKHLWRGGHDQNAVRKALKVELKEATAASANRKFTLSLTNIGTEHRLPTGAPDRHLEISFRVYDAKKKLINEKKHFTQRTIL